MKLKKSILILPGTERIIFKFLWLPRTINNDTRIFEYVAIKQRFILKDGKNISYSKFNEKYQEGVWEDISFEKFSFLNMFKKVY